MRQSQLIINLMNNNQADSVVFNDVATSVLNKESRKKKRGRQTGKLAVNKSVIDDEREINGTWP